MFDNRFTSGVLVTFILLLSLVSVNSAHAGTLNEVRLLSHDGTLEVVGELMAVEAGIYIVSTRLGDVQIASDKVHCIGMACPKYVEPISTERMPHTFANGEKYQAATFETNQAAFQAKQDQENTGPFRIAN